jgi:hypothetical protein
MIRTSRTLFLGRLFGLYCVLFALSMFLHKQGNLDAVAAVLRSPSLMLFLGVILLFAGLAMVLAHNIWSGGPLRVIVTILGWLTLIKALVILFLPIGAAAQLYLLELRYDQFFYFYAAATLALGLYLTYASFKSSPTTP